MNIKNTIKHYCGRYPSIFFPLYKILAPNTHIKECLLDDKSELVIEGFPRSANTFSVVAFRQAQGRHVRMAHHLHVEAQIIEGVKRNIPVIALIREPKDSIRSLMVMYPGINVDKELSRYIEFYQRVERVKSKIVVGRFEDVISNYAKIISEVNYKFGKNYKLFHNTDSEVKSVYSEIEELNELIFSGSENHIGRPSEKRNQNYNNFETICNEKLLRRAEDLYHNIIGY